MSVSRSCAGERVAGSRGGLAPGLGDSEADSSALGLGVLDADSSATTRTSRSCRRSRSRPAGPAAPGHPGRAAAGAGGVEWRRVMEPPRIDGCPRLPRRRAAPPPGRQDVPVEYVEIARAESERGELVLRERRDEGAPPALELRANGVFVMDTVETSTERALAAAALALVEEPRAVVVGGLGSASRCTRCSPTRGSRGARSSRSSRRWSTGCATAPSRTVRRCWPTSGSWSSSPTSRPRSPRPAPRRTTWCCSTSTTAPATWCTSRTPRSTAPAFLPPPRRRCAPAARWWSGQRGRGARARGGAARGVRQRRGAPADVLLQDRDEQYWLYVARVPSAA